MTDSYLRIASYNIRKARGRDQRRDPGRVLDVINTLDADIVVLQEADRRLGQRPAALPKDLIGSYCDYRVVPLSKNDVSLGWHGNAVLVRPEIEVSVEKTLDLPGFEPRGAAIISLAGSVNVTLAATHLGLRRKDRRAQQTMICNVLPTSSPFIVAGDFNEWSSTTGFEPFERELTMHAPGKSFPTGWPMAKLDRFAVSEDLKVISSGVADTPLSRRASDHLPIWMDFSFGRVH
ncbi:endonuclease/exonuclease/phosphatase family protein [Cognatishimia activa]|uniref:Exodeoxyribonuclease III (Xth) n=1 Tax=Cognatishimia activa TaxID=1715691 RepID=A0A0P1IV93_9RHOB|nr:endonuclease/exonuclease/phosphatase family protein [Cognatishimia activa]MEE2945428.1 endonuclease/exonuclease/phosphatase family protein [Pseudomonadota bacterium]CUI97470.1 exodeoxyribonuclease III (xth) [Cognatishimia activa]CUK25941.1 exodeoxyribonuclease III (xth) [Cognatishimia activa]